MRTTRSSARRRTLSRRVGEITAVSVLVLAGPLLLGAGGAVAGAAPTAASSVAGETVPTTGYRHGSVPLFHPATAVASTLHAATASGATGTIHTFGGAAPKATADLSYGGGVGGVGVLVGTPKVYLVYYGSQWGTQASVTVGGRAYATFSGDPKGMAPVEQEFFAGLGTAGETWSGIMTQYCQGIVTGTTPCPAGAAHVGHPTSGVLAGVWEDSASPAPVDATAAQLAAQAEAAATHFGNTTPSSNRSAQYVIVSPTGTHPDGFGTAGGNFCAWHDSTADAGLGAVSQPDGILAFTNMPYLPDLTTSCGQDFVNPGAAGLLDGVTIVGGHEYAETLTDQYPAGGWLDSSGAEAGDKCAWIASGQGSASDLTLATGKFAVQSIWADDGNGGSGACELGHPYVSSSSTDVVTVVDPGAQSGTVGTSLTLPVTGTDTGTGQSLRFVAAGLPSGLTMSPTGIISGTPASATTATVTVTVTDATSATAVMAFTWKVSSAHR